MQFPIDPHQFTIKKPINCCGVGLHSGRTVNLTINPSLPNSGIQFIRTDLPSTTPIKAHMDKVVDTRLATTIGNEDVRISTTEHLLAALSSYGIDNVEIELDSPEVPIMDGSAAPFMQLLQSAGRQRQSEHRKILKIKKEIRYSDGDKNITVSPYEGFRVTGRISFEDALIKSQSYCLDVTSERFMDEICRARTFGYVEQVEELWANGLALGGTLENVIAIHWNRKSILNEDGLRYEDEFIRHKVLDIIGDMALLGCPILGHIEAYKSGHTQHLGLMQTIANSPDCWELVEFKNNGSHSVLDRVFSGTKVAEELVVPFLKHRPAAA